MNFQQVCETAKANPNTVYFYDAGNGCQGRTYYCPKRKRLIHACSHDGKVWF